MIAFAMLGLAWQYSITNQWIRILTDGPANLASKFLQTRHDSSSERRLGNPSEMRPLQQSRVGRTWREIIAD